MQRHTRARSFPPPPPTPPSDDTVRAYLPLVRKVVQRLLAHTPPNLETDELVSWGIDGLLDALRKYDPSKMATFVTYAQFRIRGAILDHLRSLDWVSRSIRQKANLLERTYRELEAELGRPATEEEAAQKLGISLEEFQGLLSDVGELTIFSLDDLGFGTGEERFNLERYVNAPDGDPVDALLNNEQVELVAEAIQRLPEKERTVITLYYHEELTMREIGAVLGLTESRVSQLHSQALLRLRGLLRSRYGGTDEAG